MGGVKTKTQTKPLDPVHHRAVVAALQQAVVAATEGDIPYVATGSLASNAWGRPLPVEDIDIVVSPRDARRYLETLDKAGFDTEETFPQWLYKASNGEATIDVIFEMQGAMYLDDEMLDRSSTISMDGVEARVIGPEDFIVSQAMSAREDTPDYWYNGLGVIARTALDWDYLAARAGRGPRRVLSLLLYAQADDLPVPQDVIEQLFEVVVAGAIE